MKALYRRAKANAQVWRTEEAKQDYQRAAELDSSLTNSVTTEIKRLDNAIKRQNAADKEKLMGKLFT